jgi:hypothetical protein
LSREAKRAQDLAQARNMIAVAEPHLDQVGDVGARPTRDAVPLGVRAAQDQRPQRCLLPFGQTRGARAWPVAQAGDTLRVIAHDRVAQRLTLHPRQPGRLGT